MPDFLPGDKVFLISREEETLFSPQKIGTFLREKTEEEQRNTEDCFEDSVVMWDNGTEESVSSTDLSLIPTRDDTCILLHASIGSLVPVSYVAGAYRHGLLIIDGFEQPYRGDIILVRMTPHHEFCWKSRARRRSCDFFDSDGSLVREGDVFKFPGIFMRWVVLWDYEDHRWAFFEITDDGYRTGRTHPIPAINKFHKVSHVWTVPPMEYGISDPHTVTPSIKLINARRK